MVLDLELNRESWPIEVVKYSSTQVPTVVQRLYKFICILYLQQQSYINLYERCTGLPYYGTWVLDYLTTSIAHDSRFSSTWYILCPYMCQHTGDAKRNTKRNYGVIVITRNYGVMRNTADLPDA